MALHREGTLVASQSYHIEKSHSSLLPAIIGELLDNVEIQVSDLQAIAVSAGPGSYTGLRIGVSTAKGLAFPLDIPLISVNSLDTMYAQVAPLIPEIDHLFCPMIDARRMEVYCFMKDASGKELWPTRPLIVDPLAFEELGEVTISYFGDGAAKCQEILTADRFRFVGEVVPNAAFMGKLSYQKFAQNDFEDIAYFEPFYLKEFRTNHPATKFKV